MPELPGQMPEQQALQVSWEQPVPQVPQVQPDGWEPAEAW